MSIVGRSLPHSTDEYNRETIQALIDYIKLLEQLVYIKGQNVEVFGLADSGGRKPELIIGSANGVKYALQVDDAGNLSTTLAS